MAHKFRNTYYSAYFYDNTITCLNAPSFVDKITDWAEKEISSAMLSLKMMTFCFLK